METMKLEMERRERLSQAEREAEDRAMEVVFRKAPPKSGTYRLNIPTSTAAPRK